MCFALQVPLPPSDEKRKVIDDVNKDRRFAIDAALVRIMKSRKIMTHQNLVVECVQQLSRMFKVRSITTILCLSYTRVGCFFSVFKYGDFFLLEKILCILRQILLIYIDSGFSLLQPDIKMIKRRIEDLITREYLERDRDAPNSFRYLA